MSFDLDPLDDAPEDIGELMSAEGAVSGPLYGGPSQCLTLRALPSQIALRKRLYTRSVTVTGSDMKTYDWGLLNIAVTGGTEDLLCGRMFIEYEILLSVPQESHDVQNLSLPAPYQPTTNQTVNGVYNTNEPLEIPATWYQTGLALGGTLLAAFGPHANGHLEVVPCDATVADRKEAGFIVVGPNAFKFPHHWEGMICHDFQIAGYMPPDSVWTTQPREEIEGCYNNLAGATFYSFVDKKSNFIVPLISPQNTCVWSFWDSDCTIAPGWLHQASTTSNPIHCSSFYHQEGDGDASPWSTGPIIYSGTPDQNRVYYSFRCRFRFYVKANKGDTFHYTVAPNSRATAGGFDKWYLIPTSLNSAMNTQTLPDLWFSPTNKYGDDYGMPKPNYLKTVRSSDPPGENLQPVASSSAPPLATTELARRTAPTRSSINGKT